jgi:hypothetical protein
MLPRATRGSGGSGSATPMNVSASTGAADGGERLAGGCFTARVIAMGNLN